MQIKSIASIVAITSALAVGPAFAQFTIGGQDLTEEDRAQVEAYCAELANEAATAAPETDNDTDGADGASDGEGVQPSATDQATTTVDLQAISLEDCTESGFTM
jgi:hypothetical protein